LERGERVVVRAGSAERVESLNAALWTYDDRGFLPHGSARDGFAADQPIWLTTESENPNGAKVLVLADGTTAEAVGDWSMVLEVFDGNDDASVTAARARWTQHKTAGHELAYWQQADDGKWQKA
jgi:DNA polymerase III subunit chi